MQDEPKVEEVKKSTDKSDFLNMLIEKKKKKLESQKIKKE